MLNLLLITCNIFRGVGKDEGGTISVLKEESEGKTFYLLDATVLCRAFEINQSAIPSSPNRHNTLTSFPTPAVRFANKPPTIGSPRFA